MTISPTQLLDSLEGRTITNGWDVVVGIGAEAANVLFGLRYADSLRGGLMQSALPPITAERTVDAGTVMVSSLQLSPPLVSVDPEGEPGEVLLAFLLLAGDLVEISEQGSFICATTVSPAAEYIVAGRVSLAGVSATSDTRGQVVLDVSESTFDVKQDVHMSAATAAALGCIVTAFLQDGVMAEFPIATLPAGNAGMLTPVSVAFSTEVVADQSDPGRLLMFFATSCNPHGGLQPPVIDDASVLVPAGYDATLVVSSSALMEMVQSSLQAALAAANVDSPVVTIQLGQPFSNVSVTGGTYTATLPPYCWFTETLSQSETQYYVAEIPVALTFSATNAFTVSFANTPGVAGGLQAAMSANWDQLLSWGGNGDPSTCVASNMQNTDSQTASATTILDATPLLMQRSEADTSVSFWFDPAFRTTLTSGQNWFTQLLESGFDPASCFRPLADSLNVAFQNLFATPLAPLELFVTLNYLFSADRQMRLRTGGLPGDLVLFATVQMPQWYLTGTPAIPGGIVVCQANASVQLQAVSPCGTLPDLTWICSAGWGQVSGSGATATYTATGLRLQRMLPAVVQVSASDGATTMQVPIIVVPQALIISPAASTAENGSMITFSASPAPQPESIIWSTDQPKLFSLSGTTGITTEGTVSPSLTQPVLATITATDSSTGLSGSAYVLLYRFLTLDVTLTPAWQEVVGSGSVTVAASGSEVVQWQIYASEAGVASLGASSGTTATVVIDASAILQPAMIYLIAIADDTFPAAVAAMRVLPG